MLSIIREFWSRQIVRYGIVGLLSLLRGYLIYLLLTWLWLDPKVAVGIMYPIGAVLNYFGHSKYTFAVRGHTFGAVMRYAIAHLIGYGTNLGLLYVFHDRWGFPHQLVQIGAIIIIPCILFVLFKYYVFQQRNQSI